MTDEKADKVISLLTEIRDALKSGVPGGGSGGGGGKSYTGWRAFVVPVFIKKQAGQALGDMVKGSLEFWFSKYEPRPYRGNISDSDVAFRAALDEAGAELKLEKKDYEDRPARKEEEPDSAGAPPALPLDEDEEPPF